MTAPGTRPVVHTEDTDRARELLAGWMSDYLRHVGHPLPNPVELLTLRGRMAAAFADCRTAAYNEGYNDHAAGVGL
jgi:hypothetical protein